MHECHLMIDHTSYLTSDRPHLDLRSVCPILMFFLFHVFFFFFSASRAMTLSRCLMVGALNPSITSLSIFRADGERERFLLRFGPFSFFICSFNNCCIGSMFSSSSWRFLSPEPLQSKHDESLPIDCIGGYMIGRVMKRLKKEGGGWCVMI